MATTRTRTRTASPLRHGEGRTVTATPGTTTAATTKTTTTSNSGSVQLAALLRQCADLVERDELTPVVHDALAELQAYCAGTPTSNTTHTTTTQPPYGTTSNGGGAGEDPWGADDDEGHTHTHATNNNTHSTTMAQPMHKSHFKLSGLGKKLAHQVGLGNNTHNTHSSEKASATTSHKNAARSKADLEQSPVATTSSSTTSTTKQKQHHPHVDQEWCEEHFCVGCACKQRRGTTTNTASTFNSTTVATATATGAAAAARSESSATTKTTSTTTNTSRPAFQRPTNPKSTLIANGWMEQQRRSKMRVVWKEVLASLVEGKKEGEETTLWIQREVHNNGKTELEALHQIPIKWVETVEYLDFSTDHRFAVKVYNVQDDFLFRCADEDSAQNWVLTLRSVKEIVKKAQVAKDVSRDDVPPVDLLEPEPQAGSHRMPVKELRAIAHGHGVNTMGMERSELEAIVAGIVAGGAGAGATTSSNAQPSAKASELDHDKEEQRQRQAAEAEAAARRRKDEEIRRRQIEEEQRARQAADDERRRRQAAEAEAQRHRLAEDELRRKQAAEAEAQRRRLAEEEQRRRQAAEAEAQRRRLAEEEQRRRAQEEAQRQQWQKQQEQWKQQQYQQQQWHHQQQQQQQQVPQWQQPPARNFPGQQAPPQQQHFFGNRSAPPPGATPRQPPPPPHPAASPASDKYAKMAHQTEDAARTSITAIKHNILIHWALQPPQLQMLRPIEMLLSTVHNVFPPSFGVSGHEYFKKWTPLALGELTHGGPMGNSPDDAKLKKAVKKLRFFLHPDKLPSNLDDNQLFMTKMLWDITNDAWEEFHKKNEELDWIRK